MYWRCLGGVLRQKPHCMVEEGMREEESEVVNAYNLIRDFVKRDNQEEG